MKTTLLSLKAFFTICLLCLVGGVNVMAQETYSYTFKSGDLKEATPKTYTFNKVEWDVSGKIAYIGWDGTKTNKGIQLASQKKNATDVTFSTTNISGTITSVKVNSSVATDGKAIISVKVGGTSWGTQTNTATTATSFDFTGTGNGEISIELKNQVKKALYIKSITVEYTTGKVTPTPTITPASKTFSESFKATISCTDAAAKIYYTLDGNTPDANSTPYTTGITIPEETTTLKAVAIKDGKASKVADAVYTYVAPVAPVAPTYTYTIWSEDWSSYETGNIPSKGKNATYECKNGKSATKIYNGTSAGGTSPELLISRNNGSLTINVTSLKGYSGTLYFSFLTNNDKFTVTSTTTDVKIGEPTKKGDKEHTCTITIPEGTEGLNLKITNINPEDGDNMRVDNLSLSAKLKDLGTGSFTITPARYGTYYTEDAFVMPEGVTGYTITEKNRESLTLNAAYPANEVVPAKTALLLKATETPATNQVFTYTIVNSDKVAPAENLLHGSVEATETHVEGATAYYKLAQGEDGLGFYWANANGTAFTNGANKAYLAVKGNFSQMRGFSFESMTTGINNVVANTNNSKNAVIYDLNGRRVNSLNAAKGVYIVNGKKVIVK